MASHPTPSSMLKESLDESLEAAKFCCEYRKVDEKWTPFNTGGCLGFPAGVHLFSIIDSIGSYFRKNKDFKIPLDSKQVIIAAAGWEHFKILNSKYFNQNLSTDFLKALYSKHRSVLTHNSIFGKDAMMIPNNSVIISPVVSGKAFFLLQHPSDGSPGYMISMMELFELCSKAVEEFKKDIDDVVPTSRSGKDFQ